MASIVVYWIVDWISGNDDGAGDATLTLSLRSIFEWHLVEGGADDGCQAAVESVAIPSRNDREMLSDIAFPYSYSSETQLFRCKDPDRMWCDMARCDAMRQITGDDK
jgi:hypothetical protein